MRTGGVPFAPAHRARRRDKPRLVLLCDVSDSVRAAARFMLEFVHAAHELFDRTRSFVFVSELGETTDLFLREPASVALGHAYGGSIVSVHANSNYGRVLREFEERYLRDLDRRTTVAILGDGRTNYHDDAAEVLDRIRGARGRARLALAGVAIPVGHRGQRDAPLRLEVHRGPRGALRSRARRGGADAPRPPLSALVSSMARRSGRR